MRDCTSDALMRDKGEASRKNAGLVSSALRASIANALMASVPDSIALCAERWTISPGVNQRSKVFR